MNGPAACLFRVELHLADADEMSNRPAIVDGHDVLCLTVAARDADEAIAAAHAHARERLEGKDGIAGTRLISVERTAIVGLLAPATAAVCSAAASGRVGRARSTAPTKAAQSRRHTKANPT